MRKLLCAFLVLLTISFLRPQAASAAIPARAKAFMTIVGYGTAGGALMGAASMAFGTSTRAVAQGASIGLYAGILFASYVLISHHNRTKGSYDDDSSPYKDSTDVYGDEYEQGEGGSDDDRSNRRSFFTRFEVIGGPQDIATKFAPKEKGGQLPPLHVNLLQYNF